MEIDVARHLGAVTRSVAELEREGNPARAVTLERTYDTTADDLWDAVTSPARLPRWFLPVSGELRLGGRYQLEGNAGGTITECEPPRFLAATWEFGGQLSWIEVRIAPEGADRSRLTLCHIAPVDDHWMKYGPGATGVGWDLGLLGLALHVSDPDAEKVDEMAFMGSPQGREYIIGSAEDWGRAALAAGEDPTRARTAARNTAAFYTGEVVQEG